jgi:hypothetical protein
MNKSTRVIEVIEMTEEEETIIWRAYYKGKRRDIIDWEIGEEDNRIQMVGEDFYRKVVRPRVDIF